MSKYSKNDAQDWANINVTGQWSTLMTPFTPEDDIDENGISNYELSVFFPDKKSFVFHL